MNANIMKLSAPIRFGVFSDPHVDIGGVNQWRMGEVSVSGLAKTVDAFNSAQLEFVLIPGDILRDGEWENVIAAKKVLKTLETPYYVVGGNHDFRPADNNKMRSGFTYLNSKEFRKSFQGHGYDSTDHRYWSQIVHPGLRVIGLDGCLENEKVGWGGELPKEQLLWLDHVLKECNESVIVMVHHGLVHLGNDAKTERGRWYSLNNSGEVRRILSRYSEKIVMVVSGHRHIGLRYQQIEGVNYFTVPSINSYPMRYCIFELQPNILSWSTPAVNFDASIHEKSLQGLSYLKSFTALDATQRDSFIRFYTNEKYRKSLISLTK